MDFDPKKNYYELLGVSEDASQEDIKKAFKKGALQHHPDKGGDQEKFKQINEAYQVLGDQSKRQQYDSFRKGGFSGFGDAFGGGGFSGGGFDMGGFDLGDLVGDLLGGFGGRQGGRGRSKGEDIQVNLSLSLKEIYQGVTKEISYKRKVIDSSLQVSDCSVCNGTGAVLQTARTPFGMMQVQNACSTCHGSGRIYTKDGKKVAGGLMTVEQTLSVKVPEGIQDGVMIRYTGMGHESVTGGAGGDVYVKINAQFPEGFVRKQDDLYVKIDVTLFDLVLGGEVRIDHPTGMLECKIPKGTQPTDLIKISNKGFGGSGMFGKRGDLILIPKLTIPKKLTKDQEKLWKELRERN